jgi:uncharacterized Tic20 family protein
MTCATCGAIVDQHVPACQLCGAPVPTAATPEHPAPQGAADPDAGSTSGPAAVRPSGADADPARPALPGGSGWAAAGSAGGGAAGAGAAGSGGWATGAPGWTAGATGGTTPPPPPPAGPGAAGWGGPQPQPHPSGLSSELRGWAIGAHLGGLVVGLGTAAVFGFAGPLLVWLFKRDEHPYLDHHAKEALNFQLTVLLVLVLSVVLAIPAALLGVLTLGIGFIALGILAVVAAVAWIVLPIIGAVKASNGEGYRYPFTIRFIA